MRERRWESQVPLDFNDVLAVCHRLEGRGLTPAAPHKDIICYIEDWAVESPEAITELDWWTIEDITLVQIRDGWQGDFFLLAGSVHTVYQQHQSIGTYCSVSHPWRLRPLFDTILPRAMFWVGFRHRHAFIRVRFHTREVVTPGERRHEADRPQWLNDRRRAFLDAVAMLDVPIDVACDDRSVTLTAPSGVPLFCSWPDAFGPCQFEYNSSDPYEFLVPASRLASTVQGPAAVRLYLTGFSTTVLNEFLSLDPSARRTYRCSAHCPVEDFPKMLEIIAPSGRLYATLCEFQSSDILLEGEEASVIVGVVGSDGAFHIEARLNRAPLAEDRMAPWLEDLLGQPVRYAPLAPFP